MGCVPVSHYHLFITVQTDSRIAVHILPMPKINIDSSILSLPRTFVPVCRICGPLHEAQHVEEVHPACHIIPDMREESKLVKLLVLADLFTGGKKSP